MAFVRFMASPMGRALRVLAGAVLIYLGWSSIGGGVGLLVALIGFVPLAAGLADFCLFGPLFGTSFNGEEIRKEARFEAWNKLDAARQGNALATDEPGVESEAQEAELADAAEPRVSSPDDHRPAAH